MGKVRMSVSFLFLLFGLVNAKTTPANDRLSNEFFTSASDIEILFKVEQRLARRFLKYVQKEGKRLDALEKQIRAIEKVLPPEGYIDDTEKWVSNLVNAYGVFSRLTRLWPNFDKYSKNNTSGNVMLRLTRDLTKLKKAYPDNDDLGGALAAIFRIQDTYDITAAEFIDGLSPYSHKMSIEEIFEMGFLCIGIEDYYHARLWLLEAFDRFPQGSTQVGFLDKASLLEYLAWSEYQIGRLELAIKHTKLVLKLSPDSNAAQANLKFFEDDLEKSKTDRSVRKVFKRKKEKWQHKHNMLCRGVEKMPQEVLEKLFCKYSQHKSRFILKPLKMEYVNDKPEIIMYHDLLRDWEMEHVKKIAKPLLNRATVHDPKTGQLVYADYRVSKSAWIFEDMDETVATIMAKVGDVVGLNMRYSEALQIANYGMAGQYEPHYDHATKKRPKQFKKWGGNRIATMLMYMSDVEIGGKTVFTKTRPGVVTQPEKGAGVFWFNLKRNGKGDPKTEHAACPVILGQKWISNLWIHEHGQEFTRPCSLNPDE